MSVNSKSSKNSPLFGETIRIPDERTSPTVWVIGVRDMFEPVLLTKHAI